MRAIEDPRIESVAKIEAGRLWEEIEARLYKSDWDFWILREKVLAGNIPKVSKTYGKEVARRVEAAIMSRAPSTVSRDVQSRVTDLLRDGAIKRHGRLRIRDRISLALTGMPWG